MREPQWLNDREMRTWQSFLAAGALVAREIERHLKQEGLSHTQYEVLVRLADAPQHSVRMTELADALYTSKSGLNYQVTLLEKAGLVRRESCDTDVRGVLAVLTDTGRARLAEIAPGHVETVRQVLIDVLTPAQQQAIAAGLGEVGRRLAQPPAKP
ncbi:MarR family transcriptional regulator [Nocardia sp. NBC_01503]|uniref:MarR family winged helix-turn-helix transcriptional regulator n=1 Tax=Nocardia sp. NBC_01503 TaxID=2975997 RepID=UPI002E7AB4A2|nr:MarR family transcriptional regulator [Nocardia sp. NBC_01503]WTL30712.1 MarR family transcriptional regulator [Nocardia sp. NBC_01503]